MIYSRDDLDLTHIYQMGLFLELYKRSALTYSRDMLPPLIEGGLLAQVTLWLTVSTSYPRVPHGSKNTKKLISPLIELRLIRHSCLGRGGWIRTNGRTKCS